MIQDSIGGTLADPIFNTGDILLDRYALEALLGHGAMGEVWQVRRITDEMRFALKVERKPGGTGFTAWEAQLLRRVCSPLVGTLYEVGDLADKRAYLIRDLVEGLPLDTIMRREKLGIANAIAITIGLARILCILHEHEVVHRDVKPSNVIVKMEDSSPIRVGLVDLGISGLLTGRSVSGSPQARPGFTGGTRLYMAPEQLLGRHTTSATDVYAVGMMLFAMLVGEPFAASDLWEEIPKRDGKSIIFGGPFVLRRLNEDPVMPESLGCPGLLGQLVERMLSREPSRRPSLATEVLPVLSTVLADVQTEILL